MPFAQVDNSEEWRLQSLQISYYQWEKDSPYRGKISFTNKSEENLTFNIPKEKMSALLALISETVVDSAIKLGHKMAGSIAKAVEAQAPQLMAPAIEEMQSEPVENTKPPLSDLNF